MKRTGNILNIAITVALVGATAGQAFALGAPMSGTDMQGFYNSAGYLPARVAWPSNMLSKAGYNAANNTQGIHRYSQQQFCIPLLFGSICNTVNYQSNYGINGNIGQMGYQNYDMTKFDNPYSIGGGWGFSSWMTGLFTGEAFNSIINGMTAQTQQMVGDTVGLVQGNFGTGAYSHFWGTNTGSFTSGAVGFSDPMDSIGGIGVSTNNGVGGTVFPGWTSRTGMGGANNTTTVPTSTCNAGVC